MDPHLAYVGRGVPRVEDVRLLTGRGAFADDFDREGQVYASIVRSNLAHGAIRSVDCEAARAMPGVTAVFTAEELPPVEIPIRLIPTESGELALQPPLARERVRYVGDPIAIVVADDPYRAEDAGAAVAIDIEPLEPVLDLSAAVADGAPILHSGLGRNLVDTRSTGTRRSVDKAFREADLIVSERLAVHRHGAAPLETRGLLASYDSVADRLSVSGVAKVKHFNRRILARLLGMDEGQLQFIEADVGGGFGARGEFYPEDFLIPWLSRHLGRPVKWTEDRRENLIALNQSREQEWDIEVAAGADGELIGFRARGLFNQGAYVRTHGSVLLGLLMQNHLPGPYRWRAYEIETGLVVTNKTPAGTYRGPGQYEPTYVRERMIDIVAERLGMDPADIRRRNLLGPDELPHRTGIADIDTGKRVVYEEGDYPQTFERLLESMDYPALRAQTEWRRAMGEWVGLATTCFVEMGNPGLFEQSRVESLEDGRFVAHVGIASVGQGVETVLSQVAADALGVPMERVEISYKDTDVVPEGQGAFSSRATVWGGQAVAGAIGAMIEDARAKAAKRAGVAIDEVRWEAGEVVWGPEAAEAGVADEPGDGVNDEAAEGDAAGRSAESGRATPFELGAGGEFRYQPGVASHILMGANVGLVSVDPDSGGVTIERFGVSYEVGKAINPLTLVGQVRGAAVQGIGGALLEEFAYSEDGQPLAASFMDYAQPTAAESPPIEVVLLELGRTDPHNPIAGAKGGGEGGIVASGATVANAVAAAVQGAANPPTGPTPGAAESASGSAFTSLPITPERVWRRFPAHS